VIANVGDSLRRKTETAMVNEALCKIRCHNLCCLVQSAYELGVTAAFWETEKPKQIENNPQEDDFAEAMAWI
jgi:hypothetical protein